jgi:Rrf2 family protein
MQISQAAGYGISTAVYLAKLLQGEVASIATICDALPMPHHFMQLIMIRLANGGVVKSTRGNIGGYSLAKPASKITLLEIVEAIDGMIGADVLVNLNGMSKNGQAAVEKALSAVATDTRKRLGAVRLSSLRPARQR